MRAGGDRTIVFDFIEEAFDQVTLAIEPFAEAQSGTQFGIGLTLARAPRAASLWRRALES
jgi:hypothetical protein